MSKQSGNTKLCSHPYTISLLSGLSQCKCLNKAVCMYILVWHLSACILTDSAVIWTLALCLRFFFSLRLWQMPCLDRGIASLLGQHQNCWPVTKKAHIPSWGTQTACHTRPQWTWFSLLPGSMSILQRRTQIPAFRSPGKSMLGKLPSISFAECFKRTPKANVEPT